jgi:ribosomal protein S18 acetylase RimI-like enzyme
VDKSEFVIEQAKDFSKDLATAVQYLATQAGENYQLLTDQDVREMVQNPQSFVARHIPSGKIVGMAFLMIYRIPYAKKAYLDDLVVDENFRKRGLATQLLESAIDIAKRHKVSYVMLTATKTRLAGNSLYEKLGFQLRNSNAYRLYL